MERLLQRKKYGGILPNMTDKMQLHYRFTEDYILLDTHDDRIVMHYNRIKAAEGQDEFLIYFEGAAYHLAKSGFTCTQEQFKSFMQDKGIRVEFYMGQF